MSTRLWVLGAADPEMDYDDHVVAMTTERVGLLETLTYYYADGATLTYYYHGGTDYRDAAGRDLSLSRRAASMRAARRAFDATRASGQDTDTSTEDNGL